MSVNASVILYETSKLNFLRKKCEMLSVHIWGLRETQFNILLSSRGVLFRFSSHLHDFLTSPSHNSLHLVLFDNDDLIMEKVKLSYTSKRSRLLQFSVPKSLQPQFVLMKGRVKEGYPLYAVLIKEVTQQIPTPLVNTYLLFYDERSEVFWQQKKQDKPSLRQRILNWLKGGNK